ncbi:hypothetical protein RIF29_28217 [Crotalaria pallida]|uniref:DUF642 domain-containing protein n=1 Tax=Crotalaria pallida TaxID=3830 RepID=A0AAN9HZI0_CROPI
MDKFKVLLVLFLSTCHAALSITDGLLPNGDFEESPKAGHLLNGTVVIFDTAIPDWTISGIVEYISSPQKQFNDKLIELQGAHSIKLITGSSIKQKVELTKGLLYSITLSAAHTCGREDRVKLSLDPSSDENELDMFFVSGDTSGDGWESFAQGFRANHTEGEIEISNFGKSDDDDPDCGVLIDSVALKVINPPKRTRGNLLKNGNFEEGPYISPNTSWGVDITPLGFDAHIPIPGWLIENINNVKYIDSDHFAIPEGKRAVELLAFGSNIALKQVVITEIGKDYELTFDVGDGKDACKGSMVVEVFAGKDSVQVPYQSEGKGGFIRGKLRFKAVSTRTNIRITSKQNLTKKDDRTICGPVIDDVKLLPS